MKLLNCQCCGSNELKRQKNGSYKCAFCGSVFILDENEELENEDAVDAKIVALYIKAEEYRQKQVYSEEIETLSKALKYDDSNALTWSKLGRAYRVCNFNGKALDCYRKAIMLDPEYGQGYTNIGSAYIVTKDYHKAVEFFEKGLPLIDCNDIDYPVVLANYGIALALNGCKIKGLQLIVKAKTMGYKDTAAALRMAGLGFFSIFFRH